jgi:hypothetical protein
VDDERSALLDEYLGVAPESARTKLFEPQSATRKL